MANIAEYDANTAKYDAWYDRYPGVFQSELLAIKDHWTRLPAKAQGIEVGLGTGRFAEQLGIKEGVEPAAAMRDLATKRSIEVMNATAEHLPYRDMRFDFVLFVTICSFDNVKKAFREAHRVLTSNGILIVAFIDGNGLIGREYERTKADSTFFTHAKFFSVDEVLDLLKECHFREPMINQTLFGNLEEIKDVQMPKEGYGLGSFTVISAIKK